MLIHVTGLGQALHPNRHLHPLRLDHPLFRRVTIRDNDAMPFGSPVTEAATEAPKQDEQMAATESTIAGSFQTFGT